MMSERGVASAISGLLTLVLAILLVCGFQQTDPKFGIGEAADTVGGIATLTTLVWLIAIEVERSRQARSDRELQSEELDRLRQHQQSQDTLLQELVAATQIVSRAGQITAANILQVHAPSIRFKGANAGTSMNPDAAYLAFENVGEKFDLTHVESGEPAISVVYRGCVSVPSGEIFQVAVNATDGKWLNTRDFSFTLTTLDGLQLTHRVKVEMKGLELRRITNG